jgi:hypothetical protein
MADPRFSSALQSITGMPDPLAPRTARAVEQPKLQQTPLDRAYQEREQTTRALGNATAQLAEFEGMQQAQKAKTAAETAQGEFQLAQQRAKDIEAPELRAERTRLRESIPKAFVPTQDNATDMATLFSLIGVIGFAVGAGGKGNAMAAMSAMNGMATGYQQGRMDLYAREKDKFETNVKALKTRIDSINDELDDVMQTAAVNYDKGMAQLKMVATKNDADFIARYADKYGLPKAVEYLRSLDKSARDTVDRLEKERTRADEKERQMMFQIQMQEDRQREARALRQIAQAGGGTPQYQLVEQDGKVMAINLRNPAAPPIETALKPGSKKFGTQTRGGAANDRYAFNIHESALQATTDLLNITSQPADTVLGTFAGMTGKSGETLTTALRNTFARKITSDDQRLMQQMIAGLEYNMGRALGGGYANSSAKAVLDIYKQQVAQAGDSPAAQAMFLARMKQELKTLFKAFKNHPGAQPGYIDDLKEASTLLDETIPFDVKDVTNASRGTRQTFVDKYVPTMEGSPRLALPTAETQTFGAKSFATEAEAQAAFKAGTLKSGEKVIINGVRGTWE